MPENVFSIEKVEIPTLSQTAPDGCEFCQYCTHIRQALLYKGRQNPAVFVTDLEKLKKGGKNDQSYTSNSRE
jgi:predicted nucleotide-binding protein (sugar kinase/HSP70/actin superfamily)